MATIYRRGRQYWGRLQRQGRDLRQSLKTTDKSVALRRLSEWIEEIDRVARGGRARHTFDEAMLRFIEEHLPTLKPTAARRYLISIALLTDAFEGKRLEQITSGALADFEASRRRDGRKIPEKMLGHRQPKPLSPATIRRDLACLSSMFGCCMEWEWLEINPVPAYLKSRRKRGLKESPPKTRYLTKAEETALLAAARHTAADPNLHDAICLAIDTGLRRDELFGLERAHINFGRKQIELPPDVTKSGHERNVPLLPRAQAILAQKPAQLRSSYVLVNSATRSRYSQLNRGLAGAVKRAKIKPLTWHDLRRTCGCRLLQDYRLSMEQVSRWLGHSSIVVTEKTYAFLEDEHLHQAIEAGTIPGTRTAEKGRK